MTNKPLKNIDSARRTQFLRVLFWAFPPIFILGLLIGLSIFESLAMGIIIGTTVGLLFNVIIYYTIEYTGSFGVNFLYGKRKSVWSNLEKYEGPLNQARHLKVKNEYASAHNIVNEILSKAPDLPEALYLKAQILWEGYQKSEPSKILLAKILTVVPDKSETYNRWAHTLLDQINREQH